MPGIRAARWPGVTYPSGNRIRYTLDATGRTGSIVLESAGSTLLANIAHQPFGPVARWTWGNGTPYARRFDLAGRLIAYPLGSHTERSLTYDAAGRIIAFVHRSDNGTAPLDQAFSYDAQDRLFNASAGTASQTFRYDANGNQTAIEYDGASFANSIDPASNRLLATTGPATTQTNTYDAAGNLTGDGTYTYNYSDRGRLQSATTDSLTVAYRYNGLGQRVQKTSQNRHRPACESNGSDQFEQLIAILRERLERIVAKLQAAPDGKWWQAAHKAVLRKEVAQARSALEERLAQWRRGREAQQECERAAAAAIASIATFYVYDEQGHLLGEYDAAGKPIQETVYLGDMPVAVLKPGPQGTVVNHVYADHLNTPRAITATNNSLVWRWDSGDPFGVAAPDQNPSGMGVFEYNMRFPGQLADKETYLVQNGARDYDAMVGRYVQSDPIGLDGGINTYSYVGGNPIGFADPTGLQVFIPTPMGPIPVPIIPAGGGVILPPPGGYPPGIEYPFSPDPTHAIIGVPPLNLPLPPKPDCETIFNLCRSAADACPSIGQKVSTYATCIVGYAICKKVFKD